MSITVFENFRKSCETAKNMNNGQIPDFKIEENTDNEDLHNSKIWIKCKNKFGIYYTIFMLTSENIQLRYEDWMGFTKYQEVLSKIVRKCGLSNYGNEWGQLYEHINQNVLNDAHNLSQHIYQYYYPLELIPRKCKTIDRIKTKHSEKKRDKEFKVNSDFIAFRVKVSEPTNIPAVIEYIANKTNEIGGVYHIRNPIINNNKLTDIIQYIYVYLPIVGYIMEFQVGHPLSMFVFSIDSKIRDGEKLVDLWNNNFYSNLVKHILGEITYDYSNEVKKLYCDNDIPSELTAILQKL